MCTACVENNDFRMMNAPVCAFRNNEPITYRTDANDADDDIPLSETRGDSGCAIIVIVQFSRCECEFIG